MVNNRLLSERRSHPTTFINYFIHILCVNSGWRNYLVDIQRSKGTIYEIHPSFTLERPIWTQLDPVRSRSGSQKIDSVFLESGKNAIG